MIWPFGYDGVSRFQGRSIVAYFMTCVPLSLARCANPMPLRAHVVGCGKDFCYSLELIAVSFAPAVSSLFGTVAAHWYFSFCARRLSRC